MTRIDAGGAQNGLPAFSNAFGEFNAKIAAIKEAMEVQQAKITGISKDKEELRDELIGKTLKISRAIIAYAENESNRTLQDKVNFTPSSLKYERDTVASQNCQLIKDEAEKVVADLLDYGIVQADLDELQTAIDNYQGAIPTPRQAIRARRDATASLVQLIAEADIVLLKKMDMLMEQFKEAEPGFHEAFKGGKLIVNSGKRDTRLEGRLTDHETGTGIAAAIVELRNKDSEPVDMTETDDAGNFVFNHLVTGIYTAVAEKEGSVFNGVQKVDVRRGKINKVVLVLNRIETSETDNE